MSTVAGVAVDLMKGEGMKFAGLALAALCAGTMAQAQTVLEPGTRMCLETAQSSGTSFETCITTAMAQCDAYEKVSAAALDCLVAARNEWGAEIRKELEAYALDDPSLKRIAEIEAKYITLRNVINCDRQMELSLVDRQPSDIDKHNSATCQAMGAAASYVEFLIRTGIVQPVR
jgi:hypothetical protein